MVQDVGIPHFGITVGCLGGRRFRANIDNGTGPSVRICVYLAAFFSSVEKEVGECFHFITDVQAIGTSGSLLFSWMKLVILTSQIPRRSSGRGGGGRVANINHVTGSIIAILEHGATRFGTVE